MFFLDLDTRAGESIPGQVGVDIPGTDHGDQDPGVGELRPQTVRPGRHRVLAGRVRSPVRYRQQALDTGDDQHVARATCRHHAQEVDRHQPRVDRNVRLQTSASDRETRVVDQDVQVTK